MIIGHSSLAGYISANPSRPLVVKIHNDLFLSPKASADEVKKMDERYDKKLEDVFKYYTPLVIGYGGNDGSLMNYLNELNHIEEGIFWFYREGDKQKQSIIDLVEKFKGSFVEIKGFDELMIQLGNKLELKPLDTKIEEIAKKRIDNYRKQVESITKKESEKADQETKDALSGITSRGEKTWWHYQLLVENETDPDKQNEIYLKGIKEFPNSHELHGNYANFLKNIKKNYDEAEKYYLKALELDPDNANKNGNYAKHLIISKRKEETKAYINKAFELNGNEENGLTLELWFYCCAIFPDGYPESKTKIEELLKKGVQSVGWDLSEVLKIAKKENHPDYETLVEFDKRITQPY